MKRYIKLNSNNEIIDLFFECWKDRFDGTEILLDEVEGMDVYINGKCISDDIGNPVFKHLGNGKVEEIDTYKSQLEAYKKEIEKQKEDEKYEAEIQAELRAMAIERIEAKKAV